MRHMEAPPAIHPIQLSSLPHPVARPHSEGLHSPNTHLSSSLASEGKRRMRAHTDRHIRAPIMMKLEASLLPRCLATRPHHQATQAELKSPFLWEQGSLRTKYNAQHQSSKGQTVHAHAKVCPPPSPQQQVHRSAPPGLRWSPPGTAEVRALRSCFHVPQ